MPKWVAEQKAKEKKKKEETGKKAQSSSVSTGKAKGTFAGGTGNYGKKTTTTTGKTTSTTKKSTVNNDPKETRRQESARTVRTAVSRFANEDRRKAGQTQKANMPTAEEKRTSREVTKAAGKAVSNSVRESMSDSGRARAQRQKSGIQTEEDRQYNERRNQRRVEVAKNTGRTASKGFQDTLTGYGKTLADVDEMAKSNENWTRAKASKLGIDQNDKAGIAKVEAERQQSIKEAREFRLDLGDKQDERQAEYDEATKNATGLEKAWYGAVESGVGMATDMAIGAVTGTGELGTLASMGIRTYGTTRGQAEKEGATESEDRLYSFLQAVKEVGTERVFAGAGLAKGYAGKSALSIGDILAKAATKNMTGAGANLTAAGIRFLGGVGEENAEEILGWGLDPIIAELAYKGNVRRREAKARLRKESDEMRAQITDENTARTMAAYLSSDDFIERNKQEYIDSGLSEANAEKLAYQMRDYLTASLSGDIDEMERLEDEMAKSIAGKGLSRESWSFSELKDTIASTTLLTALTGLPGAVSSTKQGAQLKAQMGDAGIKALANTAIDFEDKEMSAKAEVMSDRIESGKEITNTQAYDLKQGMIKQLQKDASRVTASRSSAQTKIENQNLITPYSITNDGMLELGEATSKTKNENAKAAKTAIQAVNKENKDNAKYHIDAKQVRSGSEAIAAFQTGLMTIDDANMLTYSNKVVRAAFKETTGIDLDQYIVRKRNGEVDIPATNAKTKDALFVLASDNLVASAQAETTNWMNTAKGEVVTNVSARMGAQGAVDLQYVLDDVDERNRSEYLMVANAADMMYQQGRNIGIEWNQVADTAKSMFPNVSEEKLREMYEAGRFDRDRAADTVRGKQIAIDEKIGELDTEAEPIGELLIETRNTPKGTTIRVFSELADNLGVRIHLVDRLPNGKNANGMYRKGEIWLNVNSKAQDNIGFIFMHEVTHHLRLFAPTEYAALENAVREKWFKLDPEQMQAVISNRIDLYKKYGQNLSEDEALEEIIADAAYEFLQDPDFATQVAEENDTLGKQILNSIRNALRKLRQIFASGSIFDDDYQEALFSQLDMLDEAERLWLTAYKAAVNNKAAVAIDNSARTRLSAPSEDYTIQDGNARWTDDRIDSLIKEYGASNPDYSQAYAVLINPRDFLKLTLRDKFLDKWNEGADQEDHPEVYSLNEDELRSNRQTPFLSIHSNDGTTHVVARVDGHEGRHRMRALMEAGVTSVPVVIQDMDTKYSKKSESRMLLGSQNFGDGAINNKATVDLSDLVPIKESNRDELIQKFGGEAQVRFSISDTDYMSAVKSGDMETAQRMVDEAAARAMPNTKLKGRWYHGTENEFTVFNFSQGGKNGHADGYGIYLTNDPEVTKPYGNRMIEGYVNVERPASAFERTLSDIELHRLIARTVDIEAETLQYEGYDSISDAKFDTWISNYTDTYYAGSIDKAIDEVVDSLTQFNGNDYDIILEIMTGMGIRDYDTASDFYDILTEETGIDGLETKWGDESEMADPNNPTIALAFRSEQIKDASPVTYDDDGNVIPLSERFDLENPDIRYSISDDDYMDAVNNGETKAAQKMVDQAARDSGFAVKGYHGTTADFKSFKPGDIGIHFGKNKSTARTRVGRGKNTKIIPAWIALNNPIQIDVDFGSWDADYRLADYLRDEGVLTAEEHQDALTVDNGTRRVKRSTKSANAALRDILKSKGYDGIEYNNYYEADGATSYIVFDPEQVKSAEPVTYDDNGAVIPLSERFNDQATEYRYSLSSTAEAAGLKFTKRGGRTAFLDGNGNTVDNFTAEFFLNTPIGRTLALSSSDAFNVMSKKAVDERLKFLSDVFNLINNTQDPDLIWAVSGSLGYNPSNLIDENTPQKKINESKSKFASITGNADPQYQTTIDFTTICVKTQAVIDAMSATMKQLHRGLNEHEIIDIVYNETKLAGEQVPCPVCYVFSRWVGLGNLFTKIKEFQERYPEDMDMSDIRKSYNDLSKQVDKLAKDSDIKGGKAREILDKQIRQRIEELEELEWLYKAQNKGQSLTPEQQAELDDLSAKNEVLNHWSWLGKTRLAKDYKPIPDDVLFDINAGREFATEYPAVWRYRTTRGPSLGKAAAPYSPSRLGDTIRGIASPSSLKKIGEGNRPFLSKNGINKTARNTFKNAILNAKRQNRMNGQRLQSTSDFRFEYGLDYMLSMLELEMIGAKAQMYTKVPEAVKFLASTKAEVNCSIMPKGTGLDTDGNLVFSDVTGMAWEDALALSKAYDNVQPILVAIGAEHLRTAMANDDITMIIPYHASGSSEARYISMMQTVEEAVTERTDFAEFENEHDIENATPEQKLCKKLRLDILTGKFDKSDLNEEETEALANNEILRQLYIRIYGKDETGAETKPDPKYVENFDENGNDADCLGIYLTKAQAKVMMPYEYWDKTSTKDTADAQGRAYQEYCESLGITPVFSGWDSKGNYNAELDFTKDHGYWKVLIDRCMYNNDGTYHKQSAVNLSDVDLDMLDSKMMREEVSKPLQVNNPEKTADIANRSIARITSETGEAYKPNTKYSIPTEDPDIRYSFAPEEAARSYMAEIAEDVNDIPLKDPVLEDYRVRYSMSADDFTNKILSNWDETRLTYGTRLDPSSVETDVRRLVMNVMKESDTEKQYDTNTVTEATNAAKVIFHLIRKGNPEEAAKRAWKAAEKMVQNAEFTDDSMFQRYKGIVSYLADTKITIPEALIDDEAFLEFVDDNQGKMRIVRRGEDISNVYTHLSTQYRKLFPSNVTDPVDQFLQISEVLDAIQPYREAYTSEEAAKLTEDVATALYNIAEQGEAYRSAADIMQPRIEARTKAMKERHQEAQRKIREEEKAKRERQKERADNWKRKYQERVQKDREDKAERSAKAEHNKRFGRIQKNYKWLVKRLQDNTKDSNIPEFFKKDLAKMLSVFDLQTEESKKREMHYGEDGYVRRDISNKTLQMEALRTSLEKMHDQYDQFLTNDAIVDLISDITKTAEGKTIDALSPTELKKIDDLLRALRHEFTNYNKVRIESKRVEYAGIGSAQIRSAMEHAEKFGEGNDYFGLLGIADNIVNRDEMTAAYMFRRVDPDNEGLGLMYKQIRRSFDKYVRNQAQLIEWMNEILGEYHNKGKLWNKFGSDEIDKWRSSNYAKTFDLEYGTVKLTPAQMMSLYCLAGRDQAKGHMTGVGIVVSPVTFQAKLMSDLKPKKANKSLPVKLTDADIKLISSQLTDDQKKVAKKLQELMSTKMADWGNEASMSVLGIKLFTEKDYFPIRSDKAGLTRDLDEGEFVEAIRNFGFAKAVKPNARNAIMIDDIFSVVSEHCNNMNLYNAYSESMNDFMKVYNYKERTEDGVGEYTVEQVIENAYSQKATNFIMSFMKDLNGNVSRGKRTGIDDALQTALNNAKKASVFANVRVLLQQPTAIVRAFAVIDPKYLKGIRIENGAMDEMFEHCPIALWKSWGYYDINMGKSIEDVMMNTGNWWEDRATEMYGAADNVTWTAIWQMVKAEMKDTHPDVEVGSDAYWELCNERMTEIVDFTQVVDSPLHRSHGMRSKEFHVKLATSFMAEPTLTFNMVKDGFVRSKEMWLSGDKKGAAALLGRTVSVFVLQAGTVAAAAALWDAVREGAFAGGDDDDEETLDTFFSRWWSHTAENFWGNLKLWNNIYYVKDITSFFDGYTVNNLALQGWKSVADGWAQLTGSRRVYSSKTWYENLFGGLGYLTGIPVQTLLRDSKAIYGILTSKVPGFAEATEGIAEVGDYLDSMPDRYQSTKDAVEASFAGSVIGFLVKSDSQSYNTKSSGSGSSKSDKSDKEEAEVYTVDQQIADIKEKTAGLTGEELEKKVWDLAGSGYTKLVEDADYNALADKRRIIEECGGNVDEFDQKVLDASKTAYKKTLTEDMTDADIEKQEKIKEYMLSHGLTDTELSDLCYHTYTARDLKAALRMNNEEYIMEELVKLVRAGLSREDWEKIVKYQNYGAKSYDGKYSRAEYKQSTGTYSWPITGSITSGFGHRSASSTNGVGSTNHMGIDIGASMGDPIAAADGGTVIHVGWYGGGGNTVRIRHDDGSITEYMHMSAFNCKVGDQVSKGQQIGQVGSTGNSTGPHCHFGVLDPDGNYRDPLEFLNS